MLLTPWTDHRHVNDARLDEAQYAIHTLSMTETLISQEPQPLHISCSNTNKLPVLEGTLKLLPAAPCAGMLSRQTPGSTAAANTQTLSTLSDG